MKKIAVVNIMEPAWSKAIPDEVVCNFFYAFFVIYTIFAVLSLVGTIGLAAYLKLPKGLLVANGIYGLLMFGIAATGALFHYLICDRALKPGMAAANARAAAAQSQKGY